MKTITVNVSEPVYRDFQQHARKHDRTTAELIREAMELYRAERIARGRSVRDFTPLSLGAVKRPLRPAEDLIGEMLDD
jgi:hypothetical protein